MGATLLLVCVGILAGAGIGVYGAKVSHKMFNKNLEKRLIKVIKGDLPNKYEMDGKKQNVNVFVLREKDGSETKITMGAMAKQNGK